MERMTREKMLKKLHKMADEISRKFDCETYRKMWRMCADWNSAHGDEEIMLCESEDSFGNEVFCIEDDTWFYGEV